MIRASHISRWPVPTIYRGQRDDSIKRTMVSPINAAAICPGPSSRSISTCLPSLDASIQKEYQRRRLAGTRRQLVDCDRQIQSPTVQLGRGVRSSKSETDLRRCAGTDYERPMLVREKQK